MELSKVILSRRSVRRFKADKVSDDKLRELIKAATYAPSAGNLQPWHFYVIKDALVRKRIYEEACRQEVIAGAPILLTVCAENKDIERYGERGQRLYNIQDTAAAIQNILLSAADMGLGSCWCGDFKEDSLKEILNMDNERIPVAIIAVGYGYEGFEQIAPKRNPVEQVATFIGEFEDNEESGGQEERRIEHCDIGGIVFNDVNMGEAVFNNVNLYRADISDVNLAEVRIHNCNLSNLEIYDCNLEGMKINGRDI